MIGGIVLAVILVLGAGIWLIRDPVDEVKITDEQKYTKSFVESDNSKETQARLVSQYGVRYNEITAMIYKSNPGEWDKSTLDDAYKALLYADKMQANTQTVYILKSIEAAGNAGLDIDNNSYGVTKEMRNNIQKRLDEAVEKNNEIDPKVKAELEKVL
jgi:hypothetical protein